MNNPAIVYCCKGRIHLCYTVWSIRSLLRFNYEPIEVIASTETEKDFILSRFPGIACNVLNVKMHDYPVFSYKPFVLTEYLNRIGIQHKKRNIVVCDADILWKHDPAPLFKRFYGLNWAHKITAVSPKDYEVSEVHVPASNIGLRTIQNYSKRFGIDVYPNFVVNAGLFMLNEDIFPEMLKIWIGKILRLPASEMLMSEALMSLTYAEMGLRPIADHENIKHLGVEKAKTTLQILGFMVAPPRSEGLSTGYQTAQHYYGTQRRFLHRDAVTMGLDTDGLLGTVKRDVMVKRIKGLPGIPGKLINKLRSTIGDLPFDFFQKQG